MPNTMIRTSRIASSSARPFSRLNILASNLRIISSPRRGGLLQVRFHEFVQGAIKHGLGIASFVFGSVILYHLVGMQHVRSDLTSPLGLRVFPSQDGDFLLLLSMLDFEQPRSQNAHRIFAVLHLRTFILTLDDQACRQVSDADCCRVFLDILPPGPR